MDKTQIDRLRVLAEPHIHKSKHEREMGELVLMALGRVAVLEARLLPTDFLCMGAMMAGHPNPLEHLDKFCSRCETVGHVPDDCHFAYDKKQALEPDGIYDVGAFEGDRNALRDRVKVLEREKNHEVLQREMAREQRRTAEARVVELGEDRDKWRSRARRHAPDLYPTPLPDQGGEGEKDG